MKRTLLIAYVFFCTGGTYAQRQNNVIAELDFSKRTTIEFVKNDTLRVTLLITNGHMSIAHEKPGYVVLRTKDTMYLDDRKIILKAPVKVLGWRGK